MFIRDFNPITKTKIDKVNKLLKEHFGMSITTGYPKKEKLEKIAEISDNAILKLKSSTKQFQLHPEYAKYMGVKYIVKEMIAENMYAESPANVQMKQHLNAEVIRLMDSGCNEQEAVTQCMVDFKKGPTAHSEEWALPIVMMAAKNYMEQNCSETVEELVTHNSDLNEYLLSELAKEIGINLKDAGSMEAIEEKLGLFAEVSGKSRESVVGFLNGLEEDAVAKGIKFFGAKIAERKLTDSIQYMHKLKADGKSIEEIAKELGMKPEEVKDAMSKTESVEENKSSMFDDIINELLSEEIEGTTVEEAEVVMAVRALADDIQDQVERLGRMKNEDIPAITDQMVAEMGMDRAQQFKDSAEGLIDATLQSAKSGKEGIDALVAEITGQGSAMGLGDTGELDTPAIGGDSIDDLAVEPEIDVNEPAAAGPEDEPLGRAPIEA